MRTAAAKARLAGAAWGGQPMGRVPLHSTADASHRAAVLVGHTLLVCALLAPCGSSCTPLMEQEDEDDEDAALRAVRGRLPVAPADQTRARGDRITDPSVPN